MTEAVGDLKAKILMAALECSEGDLVKTFSMEELLVQAWKKDPIALGLRGFEKDYPDSQIINREIGSRGQGQKGLVDLGLLERVSARTYRLTFKGLHTASQLTPSNAEVREKVDRELEAKVRAILNHDVFRAWLQDSSNPKSFREAGHFWGIAPGTPPRVIRERIERVEIVLTTALQQLDSRSVDEMVDGRGRVAFDRGDLDRCLDFQATLKHRFEEDLRILNAYAS